MLAVPGSPERGERHVSPEAFALPSKEERMMKWKPLFIAVMFAVLSAGAARAQSEPAELRKAAPGSALGAAVANVLFVPVRLGISVVAGELGGFTGLMTAGDENAVADVWSLFKGQAFLTPRFMAGEEPMYFGSLEFQR